MKTRPRPSNEEVLDASNKVIEKYKEAFENIESSERAQVEAKTPEVEINPKKAALLVYLERHPERCKGWARDRGNTNFPLIYNESTGEWLWVGRKERRALARKNAKKNLR